MSESYILIGGSGHAKVIMDCIRASGGEIAGILDDGLASGTTVLGVPVLGKTCDYEVYRDHAFVIAIGNNAVRRQIAEAYPVNWVSLVHPSAQIGMQVSVGKGTVVMAGAIINPCAAIGEHCIINTGAIVEHDNVLGDYVHLSPRAALGGTVRVGQQTHVGIGAAVRNNITICGMCTIGAGAVVVKSIEHSGTYVGVPAKEMV